MHLNVLYSVPRLYRSLLPTPFYRLEALSEYLGVSIFCKRDDLTGFGFGGNKTRKLDFLIADALAKSATDIIATGSVQSNFCRMAAAYAVREHLPCHLVLGGSPDHALASGNLRLDELFGAKIHRVKSDDWSDWEEAECLAQRLRNSEHKPYRMPIGGSTATGSLGYVIALLEMLEDADRMGIRIDCIVHASSSAGTQAGLLAGQAASNWSGQIVGISVAKPADALEDELFQLANETAELLNVTIDEEEILVDDRWIGEAYGIPTEEGVEAQALFARKEGIVLDDVYTAKAAAGLIGRCRTGELSPEQTVVFLHTGGSPQVFAYKEKKRKRRDADIQ